MTNEQKGINSLMQSRKKWKNRYYKIRKQLREKEKQIERYQNMLVTNDMLHIKESQEKDEIIDLMAEELALYCEINCAEDIKTNKKQIKQYFENKAKEV